MSGVNHAEDFGERSFSTPLDALIVAVAGRFGERSKEVERFLRFSVVGVVGAVVDFGTLIVLQATILSPTDATGRALRMNVAVATTIAFVAAVVSNFFWNRVWTYPDSRSRTIRQQLSQFATISVIGWLGRTLWVSLSYVALGELSMPLISSVVGVLNPEFVVTAENTAKLGTLVALFFGVVVVMFWNFFANRYWTYNDVG